MHTSRRRPLGTRQSESSEYQPQSIVSNPNDHWRLSELDESDAIDFSFWVKVFSVILAATLIILPIRNTCVYSNTDCDTSSCFTEHRARTHLQKVTSLGPRTAGSLANEVGAPKYLRRELFGIATLANRSGIHAEVDEQRSDYSGYRTHFHVTTYRNLKNFILRLHDPRQSANSSQSKRKAFLINCHYDSAISSPGASDAFVSCAIMLEIARVIVTGKSILNNDLIFLFNGAEENILPASHAFITQHRWAHDVSAFINLEGAGAGGRMTLFQSGPGNSSKYLLDAYSKAFKHPYGNVFGEDLFRSGRIPGDTDFRIFRDYGGIPGLDMAYTANGYVYHTPFDVESQILPACLQQSGEDILRFVQNVGVDDQLQHVSRLPMSPSSQKWQIVNSSLLVSDDIDQSFLHHAFTQNSPRSRYVYFDMLGYYFITVPWWLWKYFNILMTMCFVTWLVIHRKSSATTRNHWFGMLLALGFQLITQMIGFLFAYILGWITYSYGSRMSWYSSRYNIFGIFILPFLWWFFWCSSYLFRIPDGVMFRLFPARSRNVFSQANWLQRHGRINYANISRDFLDAAVFCIVIHVLLLSFLDGPSVFVATLWLTLTLSARIFLRLFVTSLNVDKSPIVMLVIILPSYCLAHVYVCANFLEFVIPVMGRSGALVRPDVLLSVLIFYMSMPVTLLLTGAMHCTSRNATQLMRLLLLNACLTYAILVHASPYGFPYSPTVNYTSTSPRPQRVVVVHSDYTFHGQPNRPDPMHVESNIFMLPLDCNGIRYLKPNSYPSIIPTSFISLFTTPSVGKPDLSPGKGLNELVDSVPNVCNRSLPYCGITPIIPMIHLFSEFYNIPTTPHKVNPPTKLTLTSQILVDNSTLGSTWNLTFAVHSGPPDVRLMIRTDPPLVRLTNWSFHPFSPPIPMPLPDGGGHSGDTESPTGAHHLVSHINAAVHGESPGDWDVPWRFWLLISRQAGVAQSDSHFDVAIGGIYMDREVSSGRSAQLDDVVARLPPWSTVWPACSTYDHWRLPLAA